MLVVLEKDTVHPVLKLQSSPTNDPFPDNVRVLLRFGLHILAFLYCSFLEPYRDAVREEQGESIAVEAISVGVHGHIWRGAACVFLNNDKSLYNAIIQMIQRQDTVCLRSCRL